MMAVVVAAFLAGGAVGVAVMLHGAPFIAFLGGVAVGVALVITWAKAYGT